MIKSKILPLFLKPLFWSYNFYSLDLKKNKKVIIKNILEYGDRRAILWLKKKYSEKEIRETVKNTLKTEWGKKSINYWSYVYNVLPKELRF